MIGGLSTAAGPEEEQAVQGIDLKRNSDVRNAKATGCSECTVRTSRFDHLFFEPVRYLPFCLLILLSLPLFAQAQSYGETDTVHVVSQTWDKYANPDGSGLFLEITRAIFESEGFQVRVEFLPYKRALHRLKAKSADAMYGTYSAEKEGKSYLVTPSNPIDKEQTVAIYRSNGANKWEGPGSLENRRLAWVRGYDYHLNLPFSAKNVSEVADSRQGLAMLAAGRFDFFLDHAGELGDTIRRTGFDVSPYGISVVHEESVYMAFADTTRGKRLASLYDSGFRKLKNSGELQRIFQRYNLAYPF